MATYIPPNIIKTPDFAGAISARTQQRKKDRIEAEAFADQFKQDDGIYLEGDVNAVQDAWNNVQSSLDFVAENPTSTQAKRNAINAQGEYAKVAGSARVRAENHRAQVAAYSQNPSAFALDGKDFMEAAKNDRSQIHSKEFIINDARSPSFILERKIKYTLSDPETESGSMVNRTSRKVRDFYNVQGKLNKEQIFNYADQIASDAIERNEATIKNALIWSAINEGIIDNYTSIDDDELINNLAPERKEQLLKGYKDELVKRYLSKIPQDLAKTTGSGFNFNFDGGKTGAKVLTPFNRTEKIAGDPIPKSVLDQIDTSLISLTDDEAIPKLQELLGPYGYEFSDAFGVNKVGVTKTSTGENVSIKFDPFPKNKKERIEELKDFIQETYTPEPTLLNVEMQAFEDAFPSNSNLAGVEAFEIRDGEMYLLVARKATQAELDEMRLEDPNFDADKVIKKEYKKAEPEQRARLVSILKSDYGLDYSGDVNQQSDEKTPNTRFDLDTYLKAKDL